MKSTAKSKTAQTTKGQLLEIPKFASDAAADAAVANGVGNAASIYYNTATNKLKVKENASWKTVTTS